ncbi:MAG: response regulator transcription factor [Lachnospiraceae bacterium]|nr:response regulator transcription factor [Lachnospiraceae bacterium]
MKVFIAEDDPIIVEGLKIALTQEGYEVESASCVAEALKKLENVDEYAICLLDVMLPDGDGYGICKAIRERSEIPVIFLTACDDEVHTVLALEKGADDYIAKPFRIRELIARMKAVIRRSGRQETSKSVEAQTQGASANAPEAADVTMVGNNEVNVMTGKVMRNGTEVFLSAVEYRLLLTFIRNKGHLLTRQQILSDMWDSAGDFVNDNTLTVYVKRLRNKLEEDGSEPLIQTVRGIGYRMV